MIRLHFEDQGQDLLWIDVNNDGTIENEELFANRWIGYRVLNLEELKKRRVQLVTIQKDRKPKQLIFPVEKIEEI